MAGEDRERTIDLLGRHDERKFVGKRNAAEGDDLLGRLAVVLAPSIGWTDCHDELLDSSYSRLVNPPGKLLRGHHLTCGIEERDADHPSFA